MPYQINKILKIRQGPFDKAVDMRILAAVEQLIHHNILWVDYKRLSPKNGLSRFLVTTAYCQRDKDYVRLVAPPRRYHKPIESITRKEKQLIDDILLVTCETCLGKSVKCPVCKGVREYVQVGHA